jgi:hypothetical protein
MNARKESETWNAGVSAHLEAMSNFASRGSNFHFFREFMEYQAARDEELWK